MTQVRMWLAVAAAVAFAGFATAQEKKPVEKKPAEDKKDDKKADKLDAAKLVGKWKIDAGMKDGDKVDTSKYNTPVEFTKDTITMKTPDGDFKFKYAVDEKTTPAGIDLEITEPEAFKSKAAGIVKLDGDTMMLAYPPMGGDRPKDFDGKKDSKTFAFTLKKAKDEKKDDTKKDDPKKDAPKKEEPKKDK